MIESDICHRFVINTFRYVYSVNIYVLNEILNNYGI